MLQQPFRLVYFTVFYFMLDVRTALRRVTAAELNRTAVQLSSVAVKIDSAACGYMGGFKGG